MLRQLKQRVARVRAHYRLRREEKQFLRQIRNAQTLKLVIGSSGVFEDGWIPSNYEYLNLLKKTDWDAAFGERKLDALLAEHVWEHLNEEDGVRALKLVSGYLKSGARVRLAVPDGYSPDTAYIDAVKPGGSGAGSDDHHVLYNVDSLERAMQDAGLQVVRLEYFDAQGAFHHVPWKKEDGMIHRSLEHDERNADGRIGYTSLILDGVKP